MTHLISCKACMLVCQRYHCMRQMYLLVAFDAVLAVALTALGTCWCCVLHMCLRWQIKNRLADPLMEKGNVGANHAVGIAMEVLSLREELETCPSTVISVIDHQKDHYIDDVLRATYEQHKREEQARNASGGGGRGSGSGGDGNRGRESEEYYEPDTN